MTEKNSARTVRIQELLSHASFVRTVARALVRDEHVADDVAQEAMVAAMGAREAPRRPMRSWLRGIVRNLARLHFRSQGRRRTHEQNAAGPDRVGSVVEAVARLELRRQVVEEVLALREPYRTALVLRYFEELMPRQIAAKLGIPIGTVTTRIQRAVHMLKSRMDARGGRTSWLPAMALIAFPAGAGAHPAARPSRVPLPIVLGALAVVAVGVTVLWPEASGPKDRTPTAADAIVPVHPGREPSRSAVPGNESPAARGATFEGRVTDGSTPLANAYVALTSERGFHHVVTDASGSFSFRAEGRFTLGVSHADFRPLFRPVSLSRARPRVEDIDLSEGGASSTVLRILDRVSRQPIAEASVLVLHGGAGPFAGANTYVDKHLLDRAPGIGAQLSLLSDTQRRRVLGGPRRLHVPAIRTDKLGLVRIRGLPPGPFIAVVSHGTHAPALVEGHARNPSQAVYLDVGARLEVHVAAFDGQPLDRLFCVVVRGGLSAAPVAAGPLERDGRVGFSHLPSGRYLVQILAGPPPFPPRLTPEIPSGGDPVAEVPAYTAREVVLRDGEAAVLTVDTRGGLAISGRIEDRAEGAVVYRVDVLPTGRWLPVASKTVTSGEEFRFGGLPAGRYRIVAHSARGGRTAADCELGAGTETARVVLRVVHAGVLEGVVRGERDVPLEGATVVVIPADEQRRAEPPSVSRTGPDGRFRVEGLSPGDHLLYFAFEEAVDVERVAVGVSRSEDIVCRLLPGDLQPLRVEVRAPGGTPVRGSIVVLDARGDDTLWFVAATARRRAGLPPAAKRFSVRLPRGRYTVGAWARGWGQSWTEEAGSDRSWLPITLKPASRARLRLEGAVEDLTGRVLVLRDTAERPVWHGVVGEARGDPAACEITVSDVAPGPYEVFLHGRSLGHVDTRTEAAATFRVPASR